MRRWFGMAIALLGSMSLLLSTGCPKQETVADTPEEGEEQPDPGPGGPKPPTDR